MALVPVDSLPILPELFDHLPVGIVVLDAAGRVVVYNQAEAELAGRAREKVLGREFFVEVAPCMNVRDIGERFRRDVGSKPIDVNLEYAFPFPHVDRPRDVRIRMLSFTSAGAPYVMLAVEDISRERAIERMKERLNELLVHDLKNPLTTVLAALDFAGRAPDVAVDVKEALEDGVVGARRLQAMLLTLLDTTRLETNAMPVRRTRIDARVLASEVARASRAAARLYGVEVVADTAAQELWVEVDQELVRRSLENLIDNGLRHAKRLVVAAADAGDRVTFAVSDDGPGIPDEVRARIFDRYVQVASPANGQSNRGLGLTFVKLVARAHGGDVEVECPPDGGTVFRLSLPKTAPPLPTL